MPRTKDWTEDEIARACDYLLKKLEEVDDRHFSFPLADVTRHIKVLSSEPDKETFLFWCELYLSAHGWKNMLTALRVRKRYHKAKGEQASTGGDRKDREIERLKKKVKELTGEVRRLQAQLAQSRTPKSSMPKMLIKRLRSALHPDRTPRPETRDKTLAELNAWLDRA